MQNAAFLTDILTLGRRARLVCDVSDGPDTGPRRLDDGAPDTRVIELLNVVIAAELVSAWHCRHQHEHALASNAHALAADFLAHSREELRHVDVLTARIEALGGQATCGDDHLGATDARAGHLPLADALRWDLAAERVAIHWLEGVARFVGTIDAVSGNLLDEALATEVGYAAGLDEHLHGTPPLPPTEPEQAIVPPTPAPSGRRRHRRGSRR
jgi:bacterioferritin